MKLMNCYVLVKKAHFVVPSLSSIEAKTINIRVLLPAVRPGDLEILFHLVR